MKFNMEFFNNKRLLVILSGVASIMVAVVIFVMSLIGFGNISAFIFGAKDKPEITEPSNTSTQQTITPTETPIVSITETPTSTVTYTPETQSTAPATTAPATDTSTPETETPTITPTETPSDIAVTKVTIAQGASRKLTEGDTLKLTAVITPDNATNKTLTWSSSKTSVAVVDANGLVAAISPGTAWITVKSGDAVAQIEIKVEAKTVAVENVVVSIKSGSQNIKVGESVTLEATPYPTSATNKTVTWSVDNPSVAKISNGKLTGLAPGTVTVTATADGKSGNITILVEEVPVEPEPGDTQ